MYAFFAIYVQSLLFSMKTDNYFSIGCKVRVSEFCFAPMSQKL